MTQEDKELLLKDLCARLPYHFICNVGGHVNRITDVHLTNFMVELSYPINIDGKGAEEYILPIQYVKPYLRQMSSMTEEEKQKYYDLTHQEDDDVWAKCLFDKMVDFCNERHLDFRGLIPMGLALEAPENMYKTH